MTWLPAGYLSRPVDPQADLDAVMSLFRARDLHEVGREESSPAWVLDTWADPKFEMSGALLVTDAGGRPAAYAEVSAADSPEVASVFVRIHPSDAGKGLGAAVLGWTERRAADLARAERIHHALGEADSAGRDLLESRGYSPVRTFWHMERSLDDAIPAPGYPIETMRPGEERAVHAVVYEAFRGHFGMTVEPFDDWWAAWRASPSLDLSLWLVARDDGGSIVGAAIDLIDGDVGWVGDVGVLQSHRGRGLGTALLLASFRAFVERGCGVARLNVDSDNATGAPRLYGRAGMRVHRVWAVYEKALPGA